MGEMRNAYRTLVGETEILEAPDADGEIKPRAPLRSFYFIIKIIALFKK
jgi:hypothetical protein